MLLLCNKLNEVLNLPRMRNGKLIGPTHCDATSADSMQYWYASKTNWNGVQYKGLIIYRY